MKNDLLKIGPITVYGYGLMIAIGIVAAYIVSVKRARSRNIDHEPILTLAIWVMIGGMLGAKLLYLMTQVDEILTNPKMVLDISNGYVVYGGIIGGILAGYVYCKKEKLNFVQYSNLAIPSVALAQGFGRIGCFLAGCCYGMETTSALGIVFHNSTLAPNGIRLVPIQLISSGLNFLNFFILIFIDKKVPNKVVGFYLIFYSIGRFILEFFRGDLARGSIGSLSTSQFISLFMFLIGWGIILRKVSSKSGEMQ
ncbi:MAG TPA: prolipoprotein diacylglyceryl transferase [Clostridiales bacterium]|nr:prolipoprotein diacylglyceryl transferase [Clostridiales bacterium]